MDLQTLGYLLMTANANRTCLALFGHSRRVRCFKVIHKFSDTALQEKGADEEPVKAAGSVLQLGPCAPLAAPSNRDPASRRTASARFGRMSAHMADVVEEEEGDMGDAPISARKVRFTAF